MSEVEQLRRWKAEASEVILGLQDLGRALGIPLGERITGPVATEAAKRLTARADGAEATLAAVRALHQPVRVPEIPTESGSLPGFVRCSCTPGLLYEDCPTRRALERRLVTCAHCGADMSDRAARGTSSVDGRPLCHPNDDGPDCYHLVTVYKHPMPCVCDGTLARVGMTPGESLTAALDDLARGRLQ